MSTTKPDAMRAALLQRVELYNASHPGSPSAVGVRFAELSPPDEVQLKLL